MYTVYSLPNTILPIFGGVIIDRYGLRCSLTFFLVINLIGNLIFAIGAIMHSFIIMLVGRFIFGGGNFISMLAIIVLVTKWFISKNLNLAYGLVMLTWGPAGAISAVTTPIIFGT